MPLETILSTFVTEEQFVSTFSVIQKVPTSLSWDEAVQRPTVLLGKIRGQGILTIFWDAKLWTLCTRPGFASAGPWF